MRSLKPIGDLNRQIQGSGPDFLKWGLRSDLSVIQSRSVWPLKQLHHDEGLALGADPVHELRICLDDPGMRLRGLLAEGVQCDSACSSTSAGKTFSAT